jgi:predicted DCC family thiol-disulfide oxidoreductase YuxK
MKPYSYQSDPAVPTFPDDKPIIVFDGECVFCSGWVNFALKADTRRRYRFLTAQSELGAAIYRHYGLDARDYETNILIEDGIAHFRSRGSIKMVAGLGFPWSVVKMLSIIPSGIADLLYEFVARNRFRIAGRKSSCYIPSADDRARFISI